MSDFVSQSSFEGGGPDLPADALDHEALAGALLRRARQLPPGAVIALQAPWGRGKTDVLARTARKTFAEDPPPGVAGRALWVNPWQYGTPDLLNPLVFELYRRVPQERLTNTDLRGAVVGLVRAGVNFGVKSASLTLPAGGLLEAAAGPALDAAEKRLTGRGQGTTADDVALMAWHFKRLCEAVISPEEREAGGRLLLCVDDLDRCLPHRQVALLEALRFLTSAGAPVTLLVAIDPTLARQAVFAHYRTEAFDPDQYLDKMFHLRVNLPAVGAEALERVVRGHLAREVLLSVGTASLQDRLVGVLGASARRLDTLAAEALSLPDLRNPRVVQRIVTKLEVLAVEGAEGLRELGDEGLRLLLLWLALGERWPGVRAAIQDGRPYFVERYKQVKARYTAGARAGSSGSGVAAVERLPSVDQAPELRQLFESVRVTDAEAAATFERLDGALARLGL